MLLHQAVRGFQLWFGVKPEVTPELRALVEEDLRQTMDAKAHARVAAQEKPKPVAKPERVRRNKKPREGFSG